MASLVIQRGFVAVSSGSEIKVLCRQSGAVTRLKISDETFSHIQVDDKPNKKSNDLSEGESTRITVIEFSPCSKYLAACNNKKQLVVWNTSTWNIINCRFITRRGSKLRFTHDSKNILLADRSGDVYLLSLTEVTEVTKPILGHICLLLDMVLSPDGKFIITCDRDEKIRVSHFPNAYNIESFCLGHSEFVNSVSILPLKSNVLISSSGDGSVKCWDYLSGVELLHINCIQHLLGNKYDDSKSGTIDCRSRRDRRLNQQSLLSQTVKKCICMHSRNLIAVLYFGSTDVSIFEINIDDHAREYYHLQNISFCNEIWDACFDDSGLLWVIQPVDSAPVIVLKIVEEADDKIKFVIDDDNEEKNVLNNDWEFFKVSIDCPNEVGMMFKQWFDNMQGYLERKEERINQKKKKLKQVK